MRYAVLVWMLLLTVLAAAPVAAAFGMKSYAAGTMPGSPNFPPPASMEMNGDFSSPEVVVAYSYNGQCNVGMVSVGYGTIEWIYFADWIEPPAWVYYLDIDNDGLLDALLPKDGGLLAVGWLAGSSAPDQPGSTELRPTAAAIPNPSRDGCQIAFSVSETGPVSVTVFDATGRRVREIMAEEMPAGFYGPRWDGHDDSGRRVAAGVYFARIQTTQGERNVRLVLAR